MMKVITVGNGKGGIGKTTTVVNLAYCFSQMGKRVLIVDGDEQSNATSCYGRVNRTGYSVIDALRQPERVNTFIFRTKYPSIDIIRGNKQLYESDVLHVDWLRKIKQIVHNDYDICLVDTPPTHNAFVMSALYASDMLLSPFEPTPYCRDGLASVEEHINSLPEDCEIIWKVFFTMVRSRRSSQRNMILNMMETSDYPIMDTFVLDSYLYEKAEELYKPVMKHRKNSSAAGDYMQLAHEVLKELEV